jgi:hypothetical protein
MEAACTGDSGAGLTFERRGRWWLRGVVSQGVSKMVTVGRRSFNTCDLDYPTIFSDVFGHFEWIVQTISDKQFESSNKNFKQYQTCLFYKIYTSYAAGV